MIIEIELRQQLGQEIADLLQDEGFEYFLAFDQIVSGWLV